MSECAEHAGMAPGWNPGTCRGCRIEYLESERAREQEDCRVLVDKVREERGTRETAEAQLATCTRLGEQTFGQLTTRAEEAERERDMAQHHHQAEQVMRKTAERERDEARAAFESCNRARRAAEAEVDEQRLLKWGFLNDYKRVRWEAQKMDAVVEAARVVREDLTCECYTQSTGCAECDTDGVRELGEALAAYDKGES